MVRHHVTERAGGIVKAATMTDADLFIDRDLYVVDMVAIPDRFEHAVGKAQHQDVLNRLFAEVMVDPVNLVFGGDLEQIGVQRLGGVKIGAERLFDDKPSPRAPVFVQHAGAAELLRDRGEGLGRRRQIEQAVAAGRTVGFELFQPLAHRAERIRLLRIGLDRGDAFQKPPRNRLVDGAGFELMQALEQAVAQLIVRHAFAGDADHAEFLGQEIGSREIIKRWNHQPMRQIPGDAKNHERTGVWLPLFLRRFIHVGPALGLTIAGLPACAGSGCGSLWPPNPSRIAERIFSAKVCSLRERKRANSAAVRTSAGTASSIAAFTVQRPSPESSTKPEYVSSAGFFANADAVRSSSQEGITLPRRHTSAMSAMSSLKRCSAGSASISAFFRMSKPSA